METLEILKEYGIYLITSTGIFLSIIFNKPKTAEKLEKIKQKRITKLKAKGQKLVNKVNTTYAELNKLEGEKNVSNKD